MKAALLSALLVPFFISMTASAESNVFCITEHSLAQEKLNPAKPLALENSNILVHATLQDNVIVSIDSLLVKVSPGNYKEFVQDSISFRGGIRQNGNLGISLQGKDLFTFFAWGGTRTVNKWVSNGNDVWFRGLVDMGLKQNALDNGALPQLIEENLFCLVK